MRPHLSRALYITSSIAAGSKIALRFPRLSVCLYLYNCASALITRAICYVIRCYVTAVYIAGFGGLQAKLQQTKVVVSCLDGENLVGSRKYPVLVAYSY